MPDEGQGVAIGNDSTWDYEPQREVWTRRRDGQVVSSTEIARSGCRHIVEYEQRFLRTARPASQARVEMTLPEDWVPLHTVAELMRLPEGTPVTVRVGRNDTPCQTCGYAECQCYWTTRDGTRLRVVAMDDGHIWNALRAAQRRGGHYLESNPRYQPLIREARRRGWYGGVPPLAVARPDPVPDEEPRDTVPAREPYKLGKRLIKID